jgi:hypothetical protein
MSMNIAAAHRSENDLLYFLHIPKTAGTSLKTFIFDHYDTQEFFDQSILEHLIKTPRLELNKYKLFCGHFGWFLPNLLSKKPKIVTMLRDPIDRTISQYNHIKRGPEFFELHERVKNIGLTDFLAGIDTSIAQLVINPQTTAFAFDDFTTNFIGNQFKSIAEIISILTDESLLKKAIERLERIEFVGLTEEFDKSIKYLCYSLGWPEPLYSIDKLNQAPRKSNPEIVSKADVGVIKKFTALDQRLYTRAREIFNDRYSSISAPEIESNYSDNMKSRAKNKSIYFGFEKAIYGSGWQGRELQSDGKVYRWTGPGAISVLDVLLNHSFHYSISFYAAAYTSEVLNSVGLKVNGEEVELDMIYPDYLHNNKECVFTGAIDSGLLLKNQCYTRIEFLVEKTICPNDLDSDSDDARSLGIYFRWLEIVTIY